MCLKSAVYVKITLTCHPIAMFQEHQTSRSRGEGVVMNLQSLPSSIPSSSSVRDKFNSNPVPLVYQQSPFWQAGKPAEVRRQCGPPLRSHPPQSPGRSCHHGLLCAYGLLLSGKVASFDWVLKTQLVVGRQRAKGGEPPTHPGPGRGSETRAQLSSWPGTTGNTCTCAVDSGSLLGGSHSYSSLFPFSISADPHNRGHHCWHPHSRLGDCTHLLSEV